MALSNFQIDRKLFHEPHFLGARAIDQLPEPGVFKDRSAMIVNLEPSTMGGSHWVALLHDDHDGFTYLDPLGLAPPLGVIDKYGEKIKYNSIEYQPLRSDKCGYYCYYFVENFLEGVPIHDILYNQLVPRPSGENDELVVTFWQAA